MRIAEKQRLEALYGRVDALEEAGTSMDVLDLLKALVALVKAQDARIDALEGKADG